MQTVSTIFLEIVNSPHTISDTLVSNSLRGYRGF